MKKAVVSAVFVFVVVLASAQSFAAEEPATGATEIHVTSFGTLTDGLGLTVGLTGNFQLVEIDTLPSPYVFYEITSVDLDLGRVYHEGVGLELGAGGTTVALENFIVDTGVSAVFADVTAPGLMVADAPVFDVVPCAPDGCMGLDGTLTVSGLGLNLSETAAGVLSAAFGVDDLTGTPIGVANSSILVPEPALLSLLGLGLMATSLRRRR